MGLTVPVVENIYVQSWAESTCPAPDQGTLLTGQGALCMLADSTP